MDYKEKLKEALNSDNTDYEVVRWIEQNFPELKESEDEKIRKDIIVLVKDWWDRVNKDNISTKEQMLAWLEKQCEHANFLSKIQVGDKVTRNEDGVLVNLSQLKRIAKPAEEYNITGIGSKNAQGKLGEMIKKLKPVNEVWEQNSADKVEPKFKTGDWVIDKQGIVHQIANVIENVTCHTYGYDIVGGGYFNDNTEGVRLWTIEDAKDGDVLKEDSCTFIIERMKPNGTAIIHCCLFDDGDFDLGSTLGFDVDSTYPATKEQRDLLFQKMKEAGYEWDGKKKELRKIEKKSALAWSEEDENHIQHISDFIMRNRVGDTDAIYRLEQDVKWLKSLKDRYTWKPSEEQMNGIECAIKTLQHQLNVGDKRLNSLYDDLKKL